MMMCRWSRYLSSLLLWRCYTALVMWLMAHSEKLEDLLEGKPVVIIEDGELALVETQ